MRIRSLDQLIQALDDDLVWRKRELTTVNFMLANPRTHQRSPLMRAAICLLYAHWEGFVKTAATSYVSFIATRGLRYRDLTPNFVALGLRTEIREAGQSNRPMNHTAIVARLMSDLKMSDSVKCSNLNSEIDWLLGLDEREPIG